MMPITTRVMSSEITFLMIMLINARVNSHWRYNCPIKNPPLQVGLCLQLNADELISRVNPPFGYYPRYSFWVEICKELVPSIVVVLLDYTDVCIVIRSLARTWFTMMSAFTSFYFEVTIWGSKPTLRTAHNSFFWKILATLVGRSCCCCQRTKQWSLSKWLFPIIMPSW